MAARNPQTQVAAPTAAPTEINEFENKTISELCTIWREYLADDQLTEGNYIIPQPTVVAILC